MGTAFLPPAQARMVLEEKRRRARVPCRHPILFWLWLIDPKGVLKCSLWEESRNLFASEGLLLSRKNLEKIFLWVIPWPGTSSKQRTYFRLFRNLGRNKNSIRRCSKRVGVYVIGICFMDKQHFSGNEGADVSLEALTPANSILKRDIVAVAVWTECQV